ncbi:MAG: hypothetical protein GY926_21190 [bacterium]|nr:hypothetical protein [bacterium]
MLHHIAIFRFKEGIAAGEIAAIRKDLLDLPDKVDSIRSNSFAKIAGMLGLAFIPANS